MIIDLHKEYWPGFGLGEDQRPLCIYTVLCLGERGDDCAAYRGIAPPMRSDTEQKDMLERIRLGGNKILEKEAREMFDLTHNGIALEYRR